MSTGVIYSGGNRALSTADGSTAQSLLDGIKTALVATGWTLHSSFAGSGGTTGYKLDCAVSPDSLQCRVKLEYAGHNIPFGPLVCEVTFSDIAEINVGTIHYLGIVGGRVYNIISCPYQLFIFTDPTQIGFDAHTVMGGIPALPKNTSAAYWSMGDYDSTFISFANTFLQSLTPNASTASFLWNNKFAKGVGPFSVQLLTQQAPTAATGSYGKINQFASGCYPVILPSIFWGEDANTKGRIRGYLWDAVVVGTGFSFATIRSFDGHGWIALTNLWDFGTLWVAFTPSQDIVASGYAY